MNQFKSKRFVAFAIGIGLFVLLVYTTVHPLIEIAGAIAIICGIYTAAETINPSRNHDLDVTSQTMNTADSSQVTTTTHSETAA